MGWKTLVVFKINTFCFLVYFSFETFLKKLILIKMVKGKIRTSKKQTKSSSSKKGNLKGKPLSSGKGPIVFGDGKLYYESDAKTSTKNKTRKPTTKQPPPIVKKKMKPSGGMKLMNKRPPTIDEARRTGGGTFIPPKPKFAKMF